MDFDGITFESLPELIAFALITERHAHDRYSRDAADMHRRGNRALADTFDRLAEEESRHVEELERFAASGNLTLDMQLAQARFEQLIGAPQSPRRNDHAGAPLSPYAVLARAVKNEELAFHFYCQVAATATSDKMREYAEAFAHEELAHAALFRTERRRAYRQRQHLVDPAIDTAMINEETVLLALALDLETDLLGRIGDRPRELADNCRRLVGALRRDLGIATATDAHPDAGQRHAAAHRLVLTGTGDITTEALDQLFWIYDRIAHTSPVEAVAQRAQSLMSVTLERIKIVN